MHSILVSTFELHASLGDPRWIVLDCRFDLLDPGAGQAAYLAGHIPGALYAHLERDLSAPPSGANGRHPLPPPEILAAVFCRWGISAGSQVVCYDEDGGGFAARAWWSLRYLGHDAAAVLDGGLAAWIEAGLPLQAGQVSRQPAEFHFQLRPSMKIDAIEIVERLRDPTLVLLDARAPERYRGDEEPIDPVAGHIPGAVNHPWQRNLDERGCLLAPNKLRARFEPVIAGAQAHDIVTYCGSGVTACHNLLALAHAGIDGARLYAGAWSEWCAHTDRPVAVGEEHRPNPAKGSSAADPPAE
jgi:thiosulfate/3-mercaptopyruvate sulfurtransferase